MAGVISPTAGTRIEPTDNYLFIRGTTATFKITFLSDGKPIVVDTATSPEAKILEPKFLADGDVPVPNILATLVGTLVPGQQFEYEFTWDIPANQTPLDTYVISYHGFLGGLYQNFGDEFFGIKHGAGQIGIKPTGYATVTDVRNKKFNIDEYLPQAIRGDVTARDNAIEFHIRCATTKLREELNLHKSRGMSENYKLFTVNYSIWSILLASRGEDGSSVSDRNIEFWREEWESILRQEKRESAMQSLPLGRG